jgi:hypothetical protein
MSTHPDETEDERQVVEDVRRVCGPILGSFLLSGYGQEQSVRGRTFPVTARVFPHPEERRLVQTRHDGWTEMPRGREPLVWAALLQGLFESPRRGSELFLYHRQVLEALGWENTSEGRAFVQRALAKYADLTILEMTPLRPTPTPPTDLRYITTLHPVVECQTTMTRERNMVSENASFRLEFSETFCAGLVSGGLFGAEWIEITIDHMVMRLGEGPQGSDNLE